MLPMDKSRRRVFVDQKKLDRLAAGSVQRRSPKWAETNRIRQCRAMGLRRLRLNLSCSMANIHRLGTTHIPDIVGMGLEVGCGCMKLLALPRAAATGTGRPDALGKQ
jgi:hypothetical protein